MFKIHQHVCKSLQDLMNCSALAWLLLLLPALLLGLACGPAAVANETLTVAALVQQGVSASPSSPTAGSANGNSPFGFHPAIVVKDGYPDNGFVDAENIGVRWHRPSRYAFWFLIQPDLNSPVYDFSLYDYQYSTVPQGIRILANIEPENPRFPKGYTLADSYIPVDVDKYKAFVRATVERYDGDGIGEEDFNNGVFPNPIKYWQVDNEPSEQLSGFAELQRITYEAIQDACSDCTVLIGGATGFPDDYISQFDSRFAPILADLAGQYVDVYDFHWYGTTNGEYRLIDTVTGEDVYEHIRATLTANGFSSELPIWITEMGSYSGDPVVFPQPPMPPQTERQQAGDYFRRFIYPLSRGIEKVFPAFGLLEGFKGNDGYFDHTGLIYDGQGSDDLGLGVKKLGYYTYKKMTEKLEGADWDTLASLHDGTEGDHLYLFRVEKAGRPVTIAWWDYFDEPGYTPGDTKPLTLTGLSGTAVTVTNVVPHYDSGSQVIDYASAFTVTTYPVSNGSATILLGEDPLLVEVESERVYLPLVLKATLREPPVGEYEIEDVEFTLKSPNGYNLSVRSIRPKLSQYPDEKFPAVLRLAGGWGPMTGLLDGEMTEKAAAEGLIFVAFDSPMRTDYPVGSPERDYKGFKDQDDVAVVLKDLVENPQVDKDLVGVWTSSSGAILAAGVLGREEYQALSKKVAFFLDNEGPHCAKDLINDPSINNELLDKWIMVKNAKVGPGKDYPTEEEFWYERCGNNFIGNYTGIYQRIQGKDDHALGYYYPHAIAYLNTATNGKAKWTRLNRQPENQVYKSEQYPNGIDIGEVLDVERFTGANDRRIWNLFFGLLKEIRGTSLQKEREPDKEYKHTFDDSPFGFLNSYIDNALTRPVYAAYGDFSTIQNFYRDLDVHWDRGSGKKGGAVWGVIEPNPPVEGSHTYNWSSLDEYVNTAQENDINLLITINPGCLWGGSRYGLPTDIEAYAAFVKALVQRYPPVKHWQIHNEVNGGVFWQDSPQNYAELVRATSDAIRENCPDCKIVLGSSINVDESGNPESITPYFEDVLEELNKDNKKYFDIFDYHFFPPRGYTPKSYYRALDKGVDLLRNLLDKYGYGNAQIWMTETMIFTTDGMSAKEIQGLPKEYRAVTERQQATSLFKTHVWALSTEVKKIFWNKLTEGPWFDFMFNRAGLIRHPTISASTDKKLAYYTYKKMTEKLAGADWDTFSTLHDGTEDDHLYLFRVEKAGGPVTIAWWDYFDEPGYTPGDTKPLTLTGLSGTAVTVTNIVPHYDSGAQVIDYASAFTVTTYPVSNGSATILLGEDPLLVEVEGERGYLPLVSTPHRRL